MNASIDTARRRMWRRTLVAGFAATATVSAVAISDATVASATTPPLGLVVEIDVRHAGTSPFVDPIEVAVYDDGRLMLGQSDFFQTGSNTPGYSERRLTPAGFAEVKSRVAAIRGEFAGHVSVRSDRLLFPCPSEQDTIRAKWWSQGAAGSLTAYSPRTCRSGDASLQARLDALVQLLDRLTGAPDAVAGPPRVYPSARISMLTYSSFDAAWIVGPSKPWPAGLSEPLAEPSAAPSVPSFEGRCEVRTSWPGLFVWILSVFTHPTTGYSTARGVTHPFVRPLLDHEASCAVDEFDLG